MNTGKTGEKRALKPLRVLIVEDSADDAALLERQLRKDGYDLTSERVETAEAMRAALKRGPWEIVISDHQMPHFSAPEALELIKAEGLNLPFIIASGTIGEENAVAAMKAGAHDCVMKDKLARLATVVERGLDKAGQRRQRKQADEALQRAYNEQAVVNRLLQISMEGLSLAQALEKAIGLLTSVSWLTVEANGAIFIVEEDPATLVMKAQHNMAAPLLSAYRQVPFGKCLCGRAAMSGHIEYSECLDSRHETQCDGIQPPGHFCVPILIENKTVGVLSLYLKAGHVREAKDDDFLRACADVLAGIIRHEQEAGKRQALEAQMQHQQKLESIGILASGVAHEINNPINGIMNYAQLIADKSGLDSAITEYAREIKHESERITGIVRNLLTFARQDTLGHSPARVSDIINATLSLIRTVMNHDQIIMQMDIPADLPTINCRSQQIQQVIMNLMTNARDSLNEKYPGYNENRIIRVSARKPGEGKLVSSEQPACSAMRSPPRRTGRLSVNCSPCETSQSKQWVRITVEDHGTGIPKHVQEHLFDPFFTTKPKNVGTGLGLSISHGIVKEHHGTLHFETQVGEYTRFHIDLPVE